MISRSRRWFIVGSSAALAVPSIIKLLPESHSAILPPIQSHVKRLARFAMYTDRAAMAQVNVILGGEVLMEIGFCENIAWAARLGDEIAVPRDYALVFDVQPARLVSHIFLTWLRSDRASFGQRIAWDDDGKATSGKLIPFNRDTVGEL